MLNVTVLISGSGTNLQAIIDRQKSGGLGDARIRAVISNNPAAYGLERARKAGIEALCLSRTAARGRRRCSISLKSLKQASSCWPVIW